MNGRSKVHEKRNLQLKYLGKNIVLSILISEQMKVTRKLIFPRFILKINSKQFDNYQTLSKLQNIRNKMRSIGVSKWAVPPVKRHEKSRNNFRRTPSLPSKILKKSTSGEMRQISLVKSYKKSSTSDLNKKNQELEWYEDDFDEDQRSSNTKWLITVQSKKNIQGSILFRWWHYRISKIFECVYQRLEHRHVAYDQQV